jgi:hypothetical protein
MDKLLKYYEDDKKNLMIAQENEFSKGHIWVCEIIYKLILKVDQKIKDLKKLNNQKDL